MLVLSNQCVYEYISLHVHDVQSRDVGSVGLDSYCNTATRTKSRILPVLGPGSDIEGYSVDIYLQKWLLGKKYILQKDFGFLKTHLRSIDCIDYVNLNTSN